MCSSWHNAHNHLLFKGTTMSTMNLLWGVFFLFVIIRVLLSVLISIEHQRVQICKKKKNRLIWFNLVERYCFNSYDSLHHRGQTPGQAKAESGVCQSNCDSPQPSNRLPPPLEILFPQPRKYFTTDSQRRAAADQHMLRSQLCGSFVEFADICNQASGTSNCMNYLHCLVVADYKVFKKMQWNE